MAVPLEKFVISGMLLMLLIIGFSVFIGGTISEYNETSVNTSFNSTYNRMADIYTKSNIIQENIIENDTVEGDPSQDFNFLDAFGVLKDAFLKLPSILVDTWHIIFGAPTSDGDSGGVLYTFAYTIGIPIEIILVIIAIGSMLLAFSVLKVILGGGRV